MTRPAKWVPSADLTKVASHCRWTQALVDGLAACEWENCTRVNSMRPEPGEISAPVVDELLVRGCVFNTGEVVKIAPLGKRTLDYLRSVGWRTDDV